MFTCKELIEARNEWPRGVVFANPEHAKAAYLFGQSYRWARKRGKSPREAMRQAQADLVTRNQRFPRSGTVYNPRIDNERGQPSERRWVEDTARAGLRFVQYADEILPHLGHKGYFTTDELGGEVLRGAVWQLPARHGKCVYVYGYEDACNEGAALIDFQYTDDLQDAARWADSRARHDAEQEREAFQEDQAEQRAQEWLEERRTLASKARAAIEWIRKGLNATEARGVLCDALEARQELYEKAQQVIDEPWRWAEL